MRKSLEVPRRALRIIRRQFSGNSVLQQTFKEITERVSDLESSFSTLNREISALRAQQSGQINVAIILQRPEAFIWVRRIWEAFSADRRCHADLVIAPFIHESSDSAKAFQETCDLARAASIPFASSEHYDLRQREVHVVVFTNPYDSTRPANLQFERVEAHSKVVYVPYGLEIGGGTENYRYQFNLNIHQRAWKVFARSHRHKGLYGKYCDGGNHHVRVTGHPKFDALIDLYDLNVDEKLKAFAVDRPAILWNPHFAADTPNSYSTFMRWKDFLLNTFQMRDDCALIVRPHPLLFERLRTSKTMTEIEIQEFKHKLSTSPNMTLDELPDPRHSFVVSSAMMSDVSSFLLEYLVTQKPVLYLINASGPGLNEDGSVVENYYPGATAEDISTFIDLIARHQDPMRASRLKMIEEYVYKPDGKASVRIKDDILNSFFPLPQTHA